MEINIKDLKEKFASVQNISQSLKEEKIRLESELATLEKDKESKLADLLEKTGTSTYDEAVNFVSTKKKELDLEMQSLDVELSNYLDTYGE
jgi:hypothetical protein